MPILCHKLTKPLKLRQKKNQEKLNLFRAVYSCPHGYHVVGLQSRSCQADGKWAGQPPACKKNSEYHHNLYYIELLEGLELGSATRVLFFWSCRRLEATVVGNRLPQGSRYLPTQSYKKHFLNNLQVHNCFCKRKKQYTILCCTL